MKIYQMQQLLIMMLSILEGDNSMMEDMKDITEQVYGIEESVELAQDNGYQIHASE